MCKNRNLRYRNLRYRKNGFWYIFANNSPIFIILFLFYLSEEDLSLKARKVAIQIIF